MEVFKNSVKQIVEGTKQYIIPLFQREYVWGKDNWEKLLENVLDLYESKDAPNHFMGAMVTMPAQTVPHGIQKFTLIYGQQRLTTIFVMLVAMRNIAKQISLNELSEEINNTLIVNNYKKKSDYYKILPTDKEHDKIAFQRLVNPNSRNDSIVNMEIKTVDHRINEAYNYFYAQIINKYSKKDIDLELFLKVVIDRLDIVSIVLSETENAYFVFESLNATGVKLLASDLIRNYFMMRFHMDEQKEVYDSYWKPLEDILTDEDTKEKEKEKDMLRDFIRYYLSAKTNAFINERDIYMTVKKQDEQIKDTKKYLEEILRYAKYYQKIAIPSKEVDAELRIAFQRLSILEVNTSSVFLLACYEDYYQNKMNKKELLEIIAILENYLFRRYVCGIESRELNKFFPTLYHIVKNYADEQAKQSGLFSDSVLKNLSNNSFAQNLRNILLEKNKKYPKDNEFQDALCKFEVYGTGTKLKKAKLILASIENYLSTKHKETINLDELTIEHIMPKTIKNTSWETTLPDNGKNYENYLHNLGNLTLTGYNSEMSNKPFKDKKNVYKISKLALNNYFENIRNWDYNSIDERSKILSEYCLQIWKSI